MVEPPIWKILVKFGSSSPIFGMKINKYVEPPTSETPISSRKLLLPPLFGENAKQRTVTFRLSISYFPCAKRRSLGDREGSHVIPPEVGTVPWLHGDFWVQFYVIWEFPKMVVPPKHPNMIIIRRKTLVVGYHHFRKPPYGDMVIPRVFGKWWSELMLQKKQTHFETYIDYHIQIISVKDNSVLTKACWYDFNTAWSHFLVAISKTNEKLGFPMKASLLFCDLTCACVALLHSAASKSHNSRSAFVWFLLQILSFTLIPHSVGSSHSSSSMACCNEPGFCPSTVQPTAKQVPKISLAVPLNSLAKLFFLICRQMSKKTSAHGNPLLN